MAGTRWREFRQVAANALRGFGSVGGMERQGIGTTAVGERGRRGTPLASAHAVAVLRLGLEDRADGTDGRESPDPAGSSRRSAAIGSVTVAMLVAAGIGIPDSGRIGPNGGTGRGSVEGSPGFTAVGSVMGTQGGRRQEHDQMQTPGIRAALAAGVVMIASGAGAQQPAAVQWRVEDGGNGHWYALTAPVVNWSAAQTRAADVGGHLATIASAEENAFAAGVAIGENVAYIGAHQLPGSPEPFGGWTWITGEPWSYQSWHFNMDDAPCGYSSGPGEQQYLWIHTAVRQWDDVNDVDFPNCELVPKRGIIEWSADCNSDGIVDYGQILQGQLADADANGIPDLCEAPTCTDADLTENGIVDGADLGAVLAFWGPVGTVLPQADIDGDGQVNGADLGILLSFWGPCGG